MNLSDRVKRLGNEPAAPCEVYIGSNGMCELQMSGSTIMAFGLTKRELFAAMAMQGQLSGQYPEGPKDTANDAVCYADALLLELSKTDKIE